MQKVARWHEIVLGRIEKKFCSLRATVSLTAYLDFKSLKYSEKQFKVGLFPQTVGPCAVQNPTESHR